MAVGNALTTLLLTSSSLVVVASPFLETRTGGNICSSGLYGEFAPVVKDLPNAQAFCTANFQCSAPLL
jgi:hypothetical protein